MSTNAKLFLTLIFIALFGLLLRLNNYDRTPPFGETMDEFIYPWAGMSLIETGTPATWSPFAAYSQKYTLKLWGEFFPIVSPYVEKPLLYPLLSGAFMLATGARDFADVRLAVLRILPIIFSVISILLIGLIATAWLNPAFTILASLLYATIPTIVLSNRLSLTENLLIPLTLGTLFIFTKWQKSRNWKLIHLLGIGCGLALLTKQSGLALPLTLLILFIKEKNWKAFTILGIYSFLFGILHPMIAFVYDWNLYVSVTEELRRAHALGLPETIYTLFRIPGIGHKESIFLDGFMLAGWILLIAIPFRKETPRLFSFMLFPYIYLITLVLGEGGTTWYGWHLFPLYPFLVIILTYTIYELWQSQNFFQFLFFFMILGSSSLRFLMLIHPALIRQWQMPMVISLVISLLFWFIYSGKMRKLFMICALVLFIVINIYTVLNLSEIYPTKAQPVSLVQ
ncbi:MAG: glycosyltransferase family 39 protein [Patescibacteria group bacterium]